MSDRSMQEFLAQEVYMMVRRNVGAAIHPVAADDVRPAFALALELLESEGKIPGEAPELREVGEGGVLAELRKELRSIMGGVHSGGMFYIDAIERLDRIAAKHRQSLARRTNDLQEALRLKGVHLGPDATEALVKALASLKEDAS